MRRRSQDEEVFCARLVDRKVECPETTLHSE